MNKYIYENIIRSIKKGLNESGLFDDDELIIDDEEDISDMIEQNIHYTLNDCKTVDDIKGYFLAKYHILDIYEKTLNVIDTLCNRFDLNLPDYVRKIGDAWCISINNITDEKLPFNMEFYITVINDVVTLKDELGEDMVMNVDRYNIYGYKYGNPKLNCMPLYLVSSSRHSINHKQLSPLMYKLVRNYNKEHSDEIILNVRDYIDEYIDFLFKPERILTELTCKGKVYPVVLKDIDRMYKCLRTGQYAGFDKITKPEKMVARLAALFIEADKMNLPSMKLEFNSDILILILLNNNNFKSYVSRRTALKDDNYIAVLQKLQKFPSLHLKDVIATYNAYKDRL